MTPSTEDPEQIRSEIDSTRRRMDDNLDALRERLRGRHLLDEIVGFFRNNQSETSELRHKVSNTVQTAADSLVNTVKTNPLPLLLVGAGVGWMIYENRRHRAETDFTSDYGDDDAELYSETARNYADPDALYDRPLDYSASGTVAPGNESVSGGMDEPAGASSGAGSKLGEAKEKVMEKASRAKEQVKQTFSHVGERVREKSHSIAEHTRDAYSRGRDRVVNTTQTHPLEVGLACLALGLVAGLVLPTPRKARELAGPTVDRLRDRTRRAGNELLEKGQRVARAAATAARDEARAQGLTMQPDQRQPAGGAPAHPAETSATHQPNPPVTEANAPSGP